MCENKKKLGRSIEERSKDVDTREEFGHWEADLVIGQKSGSDQVLLTLAERKSREYWMLPIKNREANSVMEAFQVLQEKYSEHFGEVVNYPLSKAKGVSQSLCKPPNWCKIELLSLEVFLWQEKKTAHKKQQ